MGEEQLPPEIGALIDKALADGVSLRPQQGHGKVGRLIEEVIWRPGDPNELARVIIKYVTRPMILDLDGHRFTIAPRP